MSADTNGDRRFDWDRWAGLALIYLLFFGLMEAKIRRPGVVFSGTENSQITEARQWWNGRLDLPARVHDTALHDGKVYSHFPPLFSLISALFIPLHDGVPHGILVLLLVVPLPALAYRFFWLVMTDLRLSRVASGPTWSGDRVHAGQPSEFSGKGSQAPARPIPGHQRNDGVGRLILIALASAPAVVPLFTSRPMFHHFDWVRVVTLLLGAVVLAVIFVYRVRRPPLPEVAMTIALIFGTSLWPVLDRTVRGGGVYFVNHQLCTLGLILFLGELRPGGRLWIAGTGWIAATWSRQLTLAYVIPLAVWAWRPGGLGAKKPRITGLVILVVISLGVPAILNTLKFDRPWESGYMLIYEGRDDYFARDAHEHGLFSPSFLRRNLYYANLGLPERHEITVEGKTEVHLRPNTVCTGIWWTSPILLWLLFDLPNILRDPARRRLLSAVALIYAALLFFHAAGDVQRGYNRFSMDYMPALLEIVAVPAFRGSRRWISLAFIGWSVAWFRFMI